MGTSRGIGRDLEWGSEYLKKERTKKYLFVTLELTFYPGLGANVAADALYSPHHIHRYGTDILSTYCSSNLWNIRSPLPVIYPSDSTDQKVGSSLTGCDREGIKSALIRPRLLSKGVTYRPHDILIQ